MRGNKESCSQLRFLMTGIGCSKFMFLVELMNLTFEHEGAAGERQTSNSLHWPCREIRPGFSRYATFFRFF